MALTQPLPSTYMNGHDPSWDESIVPTLRQRLQNESQMLTKRLSSPSIQMSEDYASIMSRSTDERRSAAGRRPSAIPRPSMTQERSMTQDRAASGSSQKSGTGGKVPTVKRTRTQSTPYPYDRDSGGAAIPAIPDPPNQAHSITPSSPRKADDRSSKIPKASGGLRSDSYGGSGSFNLQTRMNSARRPLPDQRMEVDGPGAITDSLSYRIRSTQILNEPPPFSPSASSMLSSELQYEQSRLVGVYTQEDAPRPSTDSVERPFEHWYRGESTRNGGVGELRVGRSEMLDIAQFGHRPQPRVNAMSGVVTVSVANAASLFVSRRTGSLDRSRSGERESWFIDDKTREAMGFGKVMDESPLTDLEDADAATDGPESVIGHRGRQRDSWRSPGRREDNTAQSAAAQEQYSIRSASTPPFASMDAITQQNPPMASSTSMGTAASVVRANSRKSTKSTKSSKSTTLTAGRRTPTSTKAMPVTSAKGAAAANGTPSAARPPTVSKVPVITQKAKAKAAAKSKPRPAPKSTPAATPELHNLASESTTDDTLVDAIPIFSTPMPRGGNWDDMVLPTVAKKLGLEGYAAPTENGVVAKNAWVLPNKRATLVLPAPGTFGYDHTKVHGKDEVVMDEFGGRQPQPHPQPPRPQLVSPSPVPSKRGPRPASPLAFAEYIEKTTPPQAPPEPHPPRTRLKRESPAIVISPPNVKEIINTDKESEHGGGCCKCVIM